MNIGKIINDILELFIKFKILEVDKFLHLSAGWILICLLNHTIETTFLIQIASLFTIAIGKEIYDLIFKKSYFDYTDAFTTVFGGVLCMLIY